MAENSAEAGPWDAFKPTAPSKPEGPWSKYRLSEGGESGRRVVKGAGKRSDDSFGELPLTDRAVLASLDNETDKKAYLSRQYGSSSVSKDKKGLIVTVGGKKMRATEGFWASLIADAPETALGIGGAVAASEGGPIASIVGAGAGAAVGRGIKESAQQISGLTRRQPKQVAESMGRAFGSGVAGEAGGRAVMAPFSKLTRGALPSLVAGQTPESRAMTERVLAGGARPPAQSTMPAARKLQRIAILADKISGPSKNIDRANIGYLQDQASKILDKAKVWGAEKDETMSRLVTSNQSAMSFQQAGKLIQNNAYQMLKNQKWGMRDEAVLKKLSAAGTSPEDAYAWLTEAAQSDRLERFFKMMGNNSVVAQSVQHRALQHLLAGALDRTAAGEAVGALGKELSQFTVKQQRLLFPGGLADDLKIFAQEVQFLYPEIKDPAMAGFTAGSIMQRNVVRRLAAQGYYSMFRAVLQRPEIIRRLAIGFRGDSIQRKAARTAVREMFYYGALEMSSPGQQPPEDEKK